MSQHVTVFVPSVEVIPLDELYELTGTEHIQVHHAADDIISHYQIEWDDVRLTITPLTEGDSQSLLDDMQEQVEDWLVGRVDKRARKVRRRVERMICAYRCTVEPDWDDDRKAQTLVQGLMAFYDYAVMFTGTALYNENGNRDVGAEHSEAKLWRAEETAETISDEAQKRKQKSIKRLKVENIPTIDHLPAIIDSAQLQPRSVAEITNRALCLWVIAQYAEERSDSVFSARTAQYGLADHFTREEQAFVDQTEPIEQDVIKFSQRIEACWTLLWAAGYVRQLGKPDHFCDTERITQIIESRSPETIVMDASMRSIDEILDEADLIYRYHWAVMDAELYGKKPPGKLEPAVTYERHYALNWLIRYHALAWDDITTDT